MSGRVFVDKPATREAVSLLIGLTGASGSGKTRSALRLATGFQRVTGGEIFFIDTEAKRGLHYADKYKFRHVPFEAPFGPLDYLAAIEHCAKQGAKTIIVDSASHEHEGPGGVLEMHETETQRLASLWRVSPEKAKMSGWQKPKSERRRLLNTIGQMPINFIFCFRAKDKIDLKGEKPKSLGWMPVAGEEFVFDMTVNCLLYPGSQGAPTWKTKEPGERFIIKPGYEEFTPMLAGQLSESTGEQLAKWAAGTAPKAAAPPKPEAAPIPGGILPGAEEAIRAKLKAQQWKGGDVKAWLMDVFKVGTIGELTQAQGDGAYELLGANDNQTLYAKILAEVRAK